MRSAIRQVAVVVAILIGLLIFGVWLFRLSTPPPGSGDSARVSSPTGVAAVAGPVGEARTPVVEVPPAATGPGLAGVVRFEDGGPGEVALRIYRDGKVVAGLDRISAPGEFSVPAWAASAEVVQAVFRSDRACMTFWCRHGDTHRTFVLSAPGVAGVRWAVPPSFGAATMSLMLYPVVDFTGEDKDVSVDSHWMSVAMAGGMCVAALVDVEAAPGGVAADAVRYSVDGVPRGDYVCVLRQRDAMGGDAVWARRVLVVDPSTDLGFVALSAERRDVRVLDANSHLPIAASARLAVGPWQTDFAVSTDEQSVARVPIVASAIWVFTSAGHVTKRVRAEDLGAEIRLEPATTHVAHGKPGSLLMTLEDGMWVAASCGADGTAELRTKASGLEDLEVVRYEPVTGTYEVTKGRADPAEMVDCHLVIASDEGPLVDGSVSLAAQDGRFVRTVSIHEGLGHVRVPRGAYSVTVRVGSQVHDNDHEYYFTRSVDGGVQDVPFHLPGGSLRLTVLDAQSRPVDGERVTIVSRGRDDARGCSWRIRSSGRVRSGLIEFSAVPAAQLSVRFGRREIASLSGPCAVTLNLP